jgi:hypothetical protein
MIFCGSLTISDSDNLSDQEIEKYRFFGRFLAHFSVSQTYSLPE